MVSTLASWIRGREIESRNRHLPQNRIIFFYFLVFPFYFSHFWSFEVKQCANIYYKYDNAGFAIKKKSKFFKMANTPHKDKTRHITWLSSFLLKVQCFYRDENDLVPDDKHCINMREKERFVVLATFWKNDNSSCFWYTNSFNWKSSFALIYYKSEDGYPNFLFSNLRLIALYINSTHLIWLKKYSVLFYFLNFWNVITFCSSCHHLQ